MREPVPPEKTILETILEWSWDRPAWQRDALRRIVAKGPLDQADVAELVELCKQDRGAAHAAPKPRPLQKVHLPASPGQGAAVSLVSIADVDAVNNLAPGQTLAFEPDGITIIYGDNGAGKSGYARILKRACRARHAGKIEPNIYAEKPEGPASATITYSIGGVEQTPEEWTEGNHPHPTLSAVSVFDSDCASVHLKEKNEVAFRPFGLDVPDELAGACQSVKNALTAEKVQLEKARNPIFARPAWQETTAVGKALAALRHDTDLRAVAALGTLTAEEGARRDRLRENISRDPARAAARQALKAENVKRLHDAVAAIEARTTGAALALVLAVARDAAVQREAARLAAERTFAGEPLADVGGDVWRALWDSARRYAEEAAYPGEPFPPAADDARCVLCQQPLSPEARDRMARFEEFIQDDTERRARRAETAAAGAREGLRSVDIRALKANIREVALEDPSLAREVRRFLAAARLRRYTTLKGLNTGQEIPLPAIPPSPAADLAGLETSLRAYAAELHTTAVVTERNKIESELRELNDRVLLGGMMQVITDEVARLKAIHDLEQCLWDTPTNAITKVGNDIADSVVTPKLRDRFQAEIVKLAADKVRVELVRSGGQYGSPQYQVRLFAKPDAKVQDILSEGEKTCVALAGFMTELATATHRSALVFDDPVSSLDHRWRKQVAQRLADEAAHRQIIVFTHDLIFVNDLSDLALEQKRPVRLVTASRGPAGAGVITESLPWRGQRVEERIDNLEKDARAAKPLYDKNQEDEYRREAARIYGDLRASWERALEDVALFRVVQRHRDYIDTKNLKKVSVLTEADCDGFHAGFKKCSDVIDAHDPSSGRNAAAPPPAEIMRDIQALKDWVASLRARQKQIA